MKFPADLATFNEEILNGKVYFCAVVFFFVKRIFIIKKYSSSEMLLFLHRSDY